jgi:hypothetical protein
MAASVSPTPIGNLRGRYTSRAENECSTNPRLKLIKVSELAKTMNSTELSKFLAKYAKLQIWPGATLPRGKFGFQSYEKGSLVSFSYILTQRLDQGQRRNYATKEKNVDGLIGILSHLPNSI